MSELFINLDLGQQNDFSAISVVDATVSNSVPSEWKSDIPYYEVPHLARFPIGTPYPEIVGSVTRLMNNLSSLHKDRCHLVIDATGVGRPVLDLFRAQGLRPIAITITGGDSVTREGDEYRVPKRDLVGALTVAFQAERLKIAAKLPDAKTLIKELLAFRVKINIRTAHDSYEAWREGDHDDLVLSVAMGCWAAKNIGVRNTANEPTADEAVGESFDYTDDFGFGMGSDEFFFEDKGSSFGRIIDGNIPGRLH